jgi:hypothetical protein
LGDASEKSDLTELLARELAEQRFVVLYEENADDLLAYARRRVPVAEERFSVPV